VGAGAQVEGLAGDSRGGHEAVGEGVGGQDFERAAGFEDGGRALLVEEIEPPIGVDG